MDIKHSSAQMRVRGYLKVSNCEKRNIEELWIYTYF